MHHLAGEPTTVDLPRPLRASLRTPSAYDDLADLLRHAGPEAEALRRSMLHGKQVLFVFGSYPGKRPMYERARELGAHLTMMDGAGHWSSQAPELFDRFVEVNLRPGPQRLEHALDAIHASGLRFDAVMTFDQGGTIFAAELAHALGLPGHPLDAVLAARDKQITRERCIAAGIPSPRHARIHSTADLATAAAHVGFPAVLKPAAGVLSLSTYRVDSPDELTRRYAQSMREAHPYEGNQAMTSEVFLGQIWGTSHDMVLEEFLDGEEFDIDCLVCAGELVYAQVLGNPPQPYMNDVGGQCPPNFPIEQQAELLELVRQSLAALGFRDGAMHVEAKYTSQGPRLLEVNARIGGGPIWLFHKAVWDVDMIEQSMMLHLGIPIRPLRAPAPRAFIASWGVPAPWSGIVTRDDFLDHLASHPCVRRCRLNAKVGQFVIGPDRGVPELLGELMVEGQSVEHTEQVMAELIESIEYAIQPINTAE